MRVSTTLAVKLSRGAPHTTWDNLREWLDTKTRGELDTVRLDILTDMVQSIVKAEV